MKKYVIAFLPILFVASLHAQVRPTGVPGHVQPESGLTLGGGTMAGPVAWNVCTQAANDTTPAVGTLPGGCNILETSDSNTGSGSGDITTFDDDLPGMILYVVGTGGTYPTNIANSGNFNLEYDWEGDTDRVLVLYVQAANDYVEVGRHDGLRVFNDQINVSGNFTDFPSAQFFASFSDTGHSDSAAIGVIGEAEATASNPGIGVKGVAESHGRQDGIGVDGQAEPDSTTDVGDCIAVRGQATTTHASGYNIGLYSEASDSATDYALWMQAGDIRSLESQDWDLYDNHGYSLSIDTNGQAGMQVFDTTDGSEKIVFNVDVEINADITANDITATGGIDAASDSTFASAQFGGGYGSTGCTITAGGRIYCDDTIQSDATGVFDGASIGGGYGSTGITLGSDGSVSADGNAAFGGTMDVTGNVTGYADLDCSSDLTVGDELLVSGVSVFDGDATVNADITANNIVARGNFDATSDVIIGGAATIAGGLTVSNDITANNITALGDIDATSDLSVGGSTSTVGVTSTGNVVVSGAQGYSEQAGTVTPAGTTQTIDWDGGNSAVIDLGSASGDVAVTMTNPASGGSYILKVVQGATTRNLTWTQVLWPSGVGPTISADEDEIDILSFYYDGTTFYGAYNQDYQ